MLLTTTENIPGRKIEVMGLVKGSTVQCKNIGRDIGASFKTLVGGEIKGYTEMIDEAVETATGRMVNAAERLGADAIIGMRYSTSSDISSFSSSAPATSVNLTVSFSLPGVLTFALPKLLALSSLFFIIRLVE